jgi:hypothetical protein
MDMLPLSTQDFSANKMVYYLLEDSIAPASLAAKCFRLAAKWNGNEAYLFTTIRRIRLLWTYYDSTSG